MLQSSESRAQIVLLGAGGHSDVIRYVIERCGRYDVVGLVADRSHPVDAGAPILGDDTILPALLAGGVTHAFVAVGANDARVRLAALVERLGFVQPAIVSVGAEVAPTSTVGPGTIVMTSAVVHPNAAIGGYCVINTGAVVEHHCRIADGAHVAPGCVLCGEVSVGRGSLIGANSTVIPGIRIGDNVIIGAGSTVIRDVPDNQVHVGNPAVRIK